MSIFAVELPVRLCADVRYKEFNFRKRAFALIILPLKRGKFQYCKDGDSKAHAWDYCTLTNGNNIPQCVGYC